jgi:hypothetical protein
MTTNQVARNKKKKGKKKLKGRIRCIGGTHAHRLEHFFKEVSSMHRR